MDFFLMISFMDHIFKTRPILFHDIPLGLSREGHFNLLGMVRSANSSLERSYYLSIIEISIAVLALKIAMEDFAGCWSIRCVGDHAPYASRI
jgi:hypothetical protein